MYQHIGCPRSQESCTELSQLFEQLSTEFLCTTFFKYGFVGNVGQCCSFCICFSIVHSGASSVLDNCKNRHRKALNVLFENMIMQIKDDFQYYNICSILIHLSILRKS